MSRIRVAARSKVKLKIAVSGLSGSGKTYSSLLLAHGITNDWTKIGLIDSENGSGELYSHLGPYHYLDLRYGADGKPARDPHSPESYMAAIKEMASTGVETIIIDSITHEWDGLGGCLESVERLGGRFSDWAKVTPRHKAFLDTILYVPCHVIATIRRKSDYTVTQEEKANGGTKQRIEKVGLKEIQREGVEYEFTLQFSIDRRHLATAEKDRTGMFSNLVPFTIGEDIGKRLKSWADGDSDRQNKVSAEKTSNLKSQSDGDQGSSASAQSYRGEPGEKKLLANLCAKEGITEKAQLKAISDELMGRPMRELDGMIALLKTKLKETKGEIHG